MTKKKRIYQLSGGEQQRVAIARALIHQPELLLADEPTGNLDSKAARDVMEILSRMNKQRQVTTMMVTHDPYSASFSDRVVFIKDGKLYNEAYRGSDQQQFYQKFLMFLHILREVAVMNFRQLIIRNLRGNFRTYAAYFVSSTFAAMVLYI